MPREYKLIGVAPPEAIPIDTDVFAIFDTTSMQVIDGQSATIALTAWHNNLPNEIPNYKGKLYIIPFQNERWVNWPKGIFEKTIVATEGSWATVAPTYRPDWSTFTAPISNLFVLAFIDETNSEYHGGVLPPNHAGEPTATYKTDYTNFITLYQGLTSTGGFFKGVCYPIIRPNCGICASFLAHGISALYGTTLTVDQISGPNGIYKVPSSSTAYVDLTILTTSSPYNAINLNQDPPGLINYKWYGIWNKTSPAQSVFTSQTFSDELNEILLEGETIENSCNIPYSITPPNSVTGP